MSHEGAHEGAHHHHHEGAHHHHHEGAHHHHEGAHHHHHEGAHHHHHSHDNTGAKQPHPCSVACAARLDDPSRESFAPTPRIIELLNVQHGSRVLDFGAGTGRYSIPIAQAHPDATVVAYDVQPGFLAIIRERVQAAAVSNIEVVDKPTGVFERVLAINVLHEVGDIDLVRMRAAVAPGGFALVIDFNADIDYPDGPPKGHAHTIDEAVSRLKAAGFQLEHRPDAAFPYHFILVAS